jgi:hypothetical protein
MSEEPRVVVCLRCAREVFAPHGGFPRRCSACGAPSGWLVAPPLKEGRYARMIVRLAQDPAVAANRTRERD